MLPGCLPPCGDPDAGRGRLCSSTTRRAPATAHPRGSERGSERAHDNESFVLKARPPPRARFTDRAQYQRAAGCSQSGDFPPPVARADRGDSRPRRQTRPHAKAGSLSPRRDANHGRRRSSLIGTYASRAEPKLRGHGFDHREVGMRRHAVTFFALAFCSASLARADLAEAGNDMPLDQAGGVCVPDSATFARAAMKPADLAWASAVETPDRSDFCVHSPWPQTCSTLRSGSSS